jgi:hypothetical protein
MRQRATILDIIEAGLRGNPERVRAYTELLIQRIEEEADAPKVERERDVAALRRLLERVDSGKQGRPIYPADAQGREGRE